MGKLFELKKDDTMYVKGIAILFVVLGHLGFFYRVAAAGVVLFLLLSGYGLVVSWSGKGLKDYWKKKIIGVWLPYVIVSVIKILATPGLSKKQILFTLIGGGTLDNVDGTMWYISYIFFWYLVFWLIALACEKCFKLEPNRLATRIVLVVCIGVIAYRQFVISEAVNILWHGSSGAHIYAFSFLLGIVMASFRDIKLNKKWLSLLYTLGMALMLGIILRLYGRCDTMLKCMLFDYCVSGVVIVSCLSKEKLFKDYIIKIGKMSYAIYLIEGYIINNKVTLLEFLPDGLPRDIICVMVVLIAGFLVHQLISNRLVKTMKGDNIGKCDCE